jgi:hypothetical protein
MDRLLSCALICDVIAVGYDLVLIGARTMMVVRSSRLRLTATPAFLAPAPRAKCKLLNLVTSGSRPSRESRPSGLIAR